MMAVLRGLKWFSSVGSLCGQPHVDIHCQYQRILLFAVFLYGGKRKTPWTVCGERERESEQTSIPEVAIP